MFSSRIDAGKQLGERLQKFSRESPVVLGVTRGGVVVAAEMAKILQAPLYPLVIKKISSEFNPEFAVGAVGPADNSPQVEKLMNFLKITDKKMGQVIKNKTVVIVDDGIATGWTVRVAVKYAKSKRVKGIILAVPVADREIVKELRPIVDELVVLEEVDGLGAVGNFYENFAQVSDEEVVDILSDR